MARVCSRRSRGSRSWCSRSSRRGPRHDQRAQPQVLLRHLRGGRGEPARRHRGSHGGREPGRGVQPPLYLQRLRPRQDASPDGGRPRREKSRAQAEHRVSDARRVRRGVPCERRGGAGRRVPPPVSERGRPAGGRRAVPHEPQGNAVRAAAPHGGAAGGGEGEAAPPGDGRAAAAKSGGGDEFGEFLADVAVTVGKAVEAWRARVGEAVLRWEGEGYRTHRLEALLQRDAPGAVDEAITAFAGDVERLKALEAEVAELDPQAAGQSVFRDPERLSEAEEAAAKVREGGAPPPGPSAAFPLAAFAVGPSNQVAVSAARAALERPGKKYNPLVLVGKSGLGKTHLLNAIGLELARGKRAVVACLSTQAFIDELISAIDGNRVDWWQARYRRATALLLDDIHLLAGKERTQEELFNLFNLLQDKDRQLVFTAPAHPNTLTGLEERIVSRLEGGLVAELKEPDRDVKRAVLERLLTQQGANPEAALIDYLSDRPTDSVRSLVGMLQRVVSAAAAQDGPLSAGLAREVLEGQSARDTRRSSGFRTSGLVVSSLGGIKSREKVVWDWADVADRMIEEFR